jgi:pilus assembly protein FimV
MLELLGTSELPQPTPSTDRMRPAQTLTAIGMALEVFALPAGAVGFGKVTNTTQIGQALNFSASLRLDADESLARECVGAEVQSGENRLLPAQIRVTLEGSGESSDRSVRVTTLTPIDEPVVTVSVTVGCTAKVTRKFVAFVDPPLINSAQAAPFETLPAQRVDSQVAPVVTVVQGERPAATIGRRPPRATANRLRPPVAAVASGDAGLDTPASPPARTDKPRRSRTAERAPAVARSAGGPRLQLEATAPLIATPASAASAALVAAATPAASSAASAPEVGGGLLALERQRIQLLEENINKLRSESQATQAALAKLQNRLQTAEAERYANPLVYALAWLSALLALGVAGLWWRQSRGRQSSQWWAGPAPAPAARPAPRPAAARLESGVSAPGAFGSPVTLADAFEIPTVIEDDDAPLTVAPPEPAPFVTSAPVTVSPPLPSEPPRELSVEELIDLEQQAEFFVVLGQDDAAIELLMSHVRSDGGISPLPYLKLLEIYRRLGDEEAYRRIRERFNRRFNSYAPDWAADLQQGRSLLDYPETIDRLQALWSASPTRVMETLDASLFRRNKTDDTFDLPAYRELLFLYSIARDLAEHAGAVPNTRVDLLLPIDDPGEEPIARLSANTLSGDFQNSDLMTMPLDLDVSFGPGTTQDVETVPSALRRAPGQGFVGDSNFLDFNLDEPKARKPGDGH